jgi:predicted ATPase
MEGKRLLHSISLKNLLSYGEGEPLKLEPLNVLIGPNASGKSNLIDAMTVLAATPRDLSVPFREGGTAEDWRWQGKEGKEGKKLGWAEIKARLDGNLDYRLRFEVVNLRPVILLEILSGHPNDEPEGGFFSRTEDLVSFASWGGEAEDAPRKIEKAGQSVLAQYKDPANFPWVTYVGDRLGSITFFRGWPLGRDSVLTRPQRADIPNDFLLPDGSNLGLVLNDLQNRPATWQLLLEKLRVLYEGVENIVTKVQGGTIQTFFHEEGFRRLPAGRVSDGTLHYLCLLTVLLHPEPPPLICIEEPELGLHPDVIPKIADLLLDASKRTQLIVTTHSETLVSRLSEVPESVVVCERDDRGTHLRRLEPDKLRVWLDKYMLGELWRMGEIGGNRW